MYLFDTVEVIDNSNKTQDYYGICPFSVHFKYEIASQSYRTY
jgi:hypothetical protein